MRKGETTWPFVCGKTWRGSSERSHRNIPTSGDSSAMGGLPSGRMYLCMSVCTIWTQIWRRDNNFCISKRYQIYGPIPHKPNGFCKHWSVFSFRMCSSDILTRTGVFIAEWSCAHLSFELDRRKILVPFGIVFGSPGVRFGKLMVIGILFR